MITGLAHINLTVPEGTLPAANAFYGTTLGLTSRPVPSGSAHRLAWFDIISPSSNTSPSEPVQQVHIAHGDASSNADTQHPHAKRHPCFRIGTADDLLKLQKRIYAHFESGGEGAPMEADKPGEPNSGSKGEEYPTRFFARDFAGNRLEFSL